MKRSGRLTPWKILSSRFLLKNKWLSVRQEKVSLPDGKVVDDYFLADLRDIAIIFAITRENEVIFERQYKHGQKEVELCLPAGMYNENESLKAAPKRELLEETGYVAKKIVYLGHLSEYATKLTHKIHVFIAEGVEFKGTNFKETMEDLEVVKIPLAEVEGIVSKNKIHAAGSIAAIHLALLHLRSKKRG